MTDRWEKRKYRGVAGSKRPPGQSGRFTRSRDTVQAVSALRGRTATDRTRAADRNGAGRRTRPRRPWTFTEALIWGAGASVIGAFVGLLYFQSWLLAGAVVLVVLLAFVRLRA